jgi:putative transposase
LTGLKKNLPYLNNQKQGLIETQNDEVSIKRQCELIGLPRSSYYYQPAKESSLNLELMRIIDETYTERPFYGVPRITHTLMQMGYPVGHKRIARLMKLMRLQGVCPKRNLSKPDSKNQKFPYLLRGLKIDRPNMVWSVDITYIRLRTGFVYLVAIIDWFSRYVLSWKLSNNLDPLFCIEALEDALMSGQPDIFNSDQGSQFTCNDFINVLKHKNIRISMDGRGRALDNIMIERLWRSVKYEEVYLKDYQSVRDAYDGLNKYLDFYNNKRIHQSLEYKPPAMVHFNRQ